MKKFPIIDISKQDVDDFEQMGTKSKFWYTDKKDKKEYLFKSTHTEDKNGSPIVRHGENWSEKVACEIAKLLGIPHANYNLARNNGVHGTVSENFTQLGDDLVFGNNLIEHVATKVFGEGLEVGQRSQTLSRVYTILNHIVVEPPRTWKKTENIKNAFDVFVGYVMLDALISNQDRHNENWGMIVDQKGQNYLSPSFDHAASLGRNESEEKMSARLNTKDEGYSVKSYIQKCKSYFYFDKKRLTTVEAFFLFTSLSKNSGLEWVQRLNNIDRDTINNILESMPDCIMTSTQKSFCVEIILENKVRLIECGNYIQHCNSLCWVTYKKNFRDKG